MNRSVSSGVQFVTLRVTPELYNEVQLSYAIHRVSPVRSTSVRHGSSCYKSLYSGLVSLGSLAEEDKRVGALLLIVRNL
ncbi:hypothetical protein AV530_013670 [Patagioenas fasciata monilis]|uniref:Uncharacterized protein n=1 Tax=Patagioenas fasciata monilis TaxID=372326 RepID=A0A1V4J7D1_PATFA|nr:hypothetical protein AV530_013670 [Patagioenas fasciata monilis]